MSRASPAVWLRQDAPEQAGDPARRAARKKKVSALDLEMKVIEVIVRPPYESCSIGEIPEGGGGTICF